MKYKIIHGEDTFEIDDNIFFNDQPEAFKNACRELRNNRTAEFDNCIVIVFQNGRIVVNNK